jgi:hypothetical protein
MRNILAFFSLLPLPVLAQSPATNALPLSAATQLSVSIGTGVAGYEERVEIETVDSEWSSPMADLRAVLSGSVGPVLLWEVRLPGPQSDADDEKWTGQGRLFQINRMEASGTSAEIAAGRGWTLTSGARTRVLAHVGTRSQEFIRDQFVTDGTSIDLGEVTEEYVLGLAGASFSLQQEVNPLLSLETKLSGSYVFFNEASNSLVPADIEGQGGYLLEAYGGVARKLSPRTTLLVGASLELQDLSGDSLSLLEMEPSGRPNFSLVEWPDNTLSRLQATLALRFRL